MYSQGKTGSSVGDCTPFLLPADELAAELHRLIRREEELLGELRFDLLLPVRVQPDGYRALVLLLGRSSTLGGRGLL